MGPLHPTRKKVSGGHTDIPYMVAVPPLLRSELARLYPRRGPREAASCKTDRNLSSVTFTRRCNRTTPPPFSLHATVGLLWICRCDNRKCRVVHTLRTVASASRADSRLRRSLVAPARCFWIVFPRQKGTPAGLLDSLPLAVTLGRNCSPRRCALGRGLE